MTTIGWNFPLNIGGSNDGFNNAGMYHFKMNKWDSLARETIQNSTDAKSKLNDGPVRVVFKMHSLPAENFPNIDQFHQILKLCADSSQQNAKASSFFQKALYTVSQPEINFLQISDYGTKGVNGSREEDQEWDSLVKSTGTSHKKGGAGGSYGIGKHAPFACSLLHTVFYGTLSEEENVTAFQGVSMLITHRNADGLKTRGTGWYGSFPDLPLSSSEGLNSMFSRTSPGTDLYIAGFIYEPSWHEQVIKSVLENFFVAIADNRLVVQVENTLIDAATLPVLLEQYLKDESKYYAYHYYKVLATPPHVKIDFHELGEVRLHLLEGKEFPKRVAMVRKTGMKIFDKGQFQIPIKFAGVFVAEGEGLNELLRNMEPPDHRSWVPDLHEEDVPLAEKIKNAIYKWINEQVNQLLSYETSEALDVDLMNQYFPTDDEDSMPDSTGGSEGEKTDPLPVIIKEIERKSSDPVALTMQESAAGQEQNGESQIPGDASTPGGDHPPGDGPSKPGDNPRPGGPSPSPNPPGPAPAPGGRDQQQRQRKSIRLKHTRAFCTNPEKALYQVSVVPEQDGEVMLKVTIVGEEEAEDTDIQSAILKPTDTIIAVRPNGIIGPITLKAGEKNIISLELKDKFRYALGVSIHEA